MAQSKVHDFDVIVIGAGLSGICFAYRLQERNPHLRYCILEGREEIGGTWSFFQYPGLRSDSDLYTFGFPWKPWNRPETIAKGEAILNYMNETMTESGIDRHVRLGRKVQDMAWSSHSKSWTISATTATSQTEAYRAAFVMLGTGYYDYETPLQARIPGLESFKGDVIHPQFWPKDYDYKDKNMIIIGSGATAITLLPSLAHSAKHVTMLQRSPGYIVSIAGEDPWERYARYWLPSSMASTLIRLKWIIIPTIFQYFCLSFPNIARRSLARRTAAQLRTPTDLSKDFTPAYNPYEQRMCMCPNGDFYECINEGKASIKTGVIEQVHPDSIRLKSGDELHPDAIITATGLKLQLGGGINISVDGSPYTIGDHYVWKNIMFEDLPNVAFSFGYFDVSWTLAVDASARMASKLLTQMHSNNVQAITPRRTEDERQYMEERRFLPLTSTYAQMALSVLPKLGDRGPWQARPWYYFDLLRIKFGDMWQGLERN